jgi:aminocarboxymuconate-semialdehyde decarboxylase
LTTLSPVVDVHAHVFPAGLADLFAETSDPRWPSLITGTESGRIMCGGSVFRHVRPPLWDVKARLDELDAAGVGVQLVSPVPVTLTYWADPAPALRFTRALNDAIAAYVASAPSRLAGLGAVPLQDVDAAIVELTRMVNELHLAGAEVGTVIEGRELDDPELRPFFAAAEQLNAVLFVHPMDGGAGVIRRSGQPYEFGVGMLTDTAIAAASLVFGGVLDDHPDLQIVLAHGCGTYPWVYPRLRMGSQLVGEHDLNRFDVLTRKLWVDALVFDPAHLPLLMHRFGAEHVVVGSDYPFVPGQLNAVPELVRSAAASGSIDDDAATAILSANAKRLLNWGC